jgi:hypothetical protein
MCAHVVLVVESDRATESEQFLASELERVGYEVVEAHNLNVAAALVFIDRRIDAVVIDAASEQVFPKLARGVSAIRPAIPLFSVASTEMRTAADGQAGHDWAIVMSALEELFGRRSA